MNYAITKGGVVFDLAVDQDEAVRRLRRLKGLMPGLTFIVVEASVRVGTIPVDIGEEGSKS